MKKVICVVSAAFLTAYAPQGADGQQESRLRHVTEVHVKPGQVPLFEAAHAGRNERMAAAGVSFVARGTVSEALVYRFVTPVGDYEGLARREAEMRGMPSRAPGAPNGNDAIDHVDTYLRWTRPDLGYAPDNPRLAGADRQAVQRVRVYVQQGKMDEVVAVLREVRELYGRHGIAEGYAVSIQGMGPDAPILEIQLSGSSLADIYEAGARIEGLLGSEMNEFRDRLGAASRRIEIDNFRIRRDLFYQPAN